MTNGPRRAGARLASRQLRGHLPHSNPRRQARRRIAPAARPRAARREPAERGDMDILRTTLNVRASRAAWPGSPGFARHDIAAARPPGHRSARALQMRPSRADHRRPDVAIVASWIDSLVATGVSGDPRRRPPDAGHFPHDGALRPEPRPGPTADLTAAQVTSTRDQDATTSPDDAAIEAGD